jgi:DNA-binding CsgD family transcriptional regulator
VGRAHELARIYDTLDGLPEGGARVLALTGEPGIGKTSLLDELRGRAEGRDFPVFHARSAEFEREPPFGIFVDALDDYLGSLNPRRFEQLSAPDAAELAGVFPSLAELSEASGLALPDERYRAHRAVGGLLELLSQRGPLVLILDDLQWAGDASIELLTHLLRRRPRGALLLALAFRKPDAPSRVVAALDPGTELVELHPLEAEDAKDLLGDEIAADARANLFRESGGNPFYLGELVRAVRDGGSYAPMTGVSGADVPAPVSGAIESELGKLGGGCRRMLEGAAVVGDPFDPELAGVAADTEEASALGLLDHLIDADLVRPTDLPRQFRFRHPIVRRAVYEATKPGWQLAAHGRVAGLLGERGAPASARAHHVERSARMGDEQAVAVLTEAGHAAASRAPAAAAQWFEAALRLLAYDGDPERRLGLLVPRATALGAAGRLRESRDALQEALALTPHEATVQRSNLAAACAGIDFLLGSADDAEALLLRTLAALPEEGSREAATVKLALAVLYIGKLQVEEMRSLAQEVLAQSEADGDGPLEASARTLLGVFAWRLGGLATARSEFDRAGELFDRLDDDELAPWLANFTWFAWGLCLFERIDSACRALDRALAVIRASGQGHLLGQVLVCQGYMHLWQGRLPQSIQSLDDAIAATELTGDDEFLIWTLMHRCWTAWLTGDGPGAIAFGERAVGLCGDRHDERAAVAHFMLAEAELEAGDAAACRERILEAGGGPELPLNEALFRPRWHAMLGRADLALGEVDLAEDWAARSQAEAENLGLAGRKGWALDIRARVLLARGDAPRAAETALAATKHLAEAGNVIEAARARAFHGEALAAAGDTPRAVAELERARSELEVSGAVHYCDQAARELRRLGRRVPRAGTAGAAAGGIASLSTRELEVAELVHQGKTNKEIARALFLSERTVETHLTHAFRKLGVKGRAGLAAAMERKRAAAPV